MEEEPKVILGMNKKQFTAYYITTAILLFILVIAIEFPNWVLILSPRYGPMKKVDYVSMPYLDACQLGLNDSECNTSIFDITRSDFGG